MRAAAFMVFLAILAAPVAALNGITTAMVYVIDPPHISSARLTAGDRTNCSWFTADLDQDERLKATVMFTDRGRLIAKRTQGCAANSTCSVVVPAWADRCAITVVDRFDMSSDATAELPDGLSGFFLAGLNRISGWFGLR